MWDGLEDTYDHEFPPGQFTRRTYSQGLYPSAKKCGLNVNDAARVTKDYRRLLDLKDVDVVCVATPDHWHARMTLDALAAGKDVYVEKPMTRTAAEAQAVVDAAAKFNRVVVVGVQGMADPSWRTANELVRANRIGPVVQAQTGRASQRRPRSVAVLPADAEDDAEDRSTGTCSSATSST